MIWKSTPKKRRKSVASGRAELTVQDAAVGEPGAAGRQVYPCVPFARPTRNAELPAGGVIIVGVAGVVSSLLSAWAAEADAHLSNQSSFSSPAYFEAFGRAD